MTCLVIRNIFLFTITYGVVWLDGDRVASETAATSVSSIWSAIWLVKMASGVENYSKILQQILRELAKRWMLPKQINTIFLYYC